MIATVALLLVAQQQGPWNNDLKLRLSDDKKPFGVETTFVRAAGVPSLTRTGNGRLLAAFQWFPFDNQTAWDRVALSWSDDDGKTWSSPKAAVFKRLPEGYQRAFDPTVTLTEDGRIRMYFTSNTSGSRLLDDTTAIYSAISSDGETYTFEPGERFAVKGRRDRFGGGQARQDMAHDRADWEPRGGRLSRHIERWPQLHTPGGYLKRRPSQLDRKSGDRWSWNVLLWMRRKRPLVELLGGW